MNAPLNNNTIPNNPSNINGGINSPLTIFEPSKFVVFLAFISPIILVSSMVGLSFVFQNFKGFIYLGFLIAAVLLREILFSKNDNYEKMRNDNTVCTAIQFSYIGNSTFSIFISCFTFLYLCFPMFINNSINWLIFSGMLFYISLDIGVKALQGCINMKKNGVQLFLDMLLGLAFAAIFTALMYAGGSGKYLFFNETSSDTEVCSQPSKQTFKCKVYQNGELLGEL